MQQFIFSRKFLPLFWVQFLGALNDNLFKNSLVLLILFQMALPKAEAVQWVTAAAGIFILPFFLFSNLAGDWSDHHDKVKMIRWIKLAEIILMLLGAVTLAFQSVVGMMAVLFLMGTQSAFFGPIKYSILPEFLPEQHLDAANGLFSASTFVAILLGTIVSGILLSLSEGYAQSVIWVAVGTLSLAGLGFLATFWIPAEPTAFLQATDRQNRRSIGQLLKQSSQYPQAFNAVLSISIFWFIGAVFLSQVPVLAQQFQPLLAAIFPFKAETLTTLMLSGFTLGIGLGAYWVVHQVVPLRQAWQAGLGLAGMILGFALFSAVWLKTGIPSEWMAVIWSGLLMGIAFAGGAFVVPFYRVMQCETPAHFRASMVATNNILNAGLMVVSAILLMVSQQFGLQLWQFLAGLSLPLFWTVRKLRNAFYA